ncbi:hypothetical protein GCM10010346_62840 [Streptomyces chryseus]|uniref:Helicase-associated domain-containing protein n=1 Tax=Streptomyces chryseus TaxID=68186 RepID=A0ABQ3ECU6_9ACTN|nr:hypothetical protein GCM10010346_62840 [Streptomyces chryseus]
MVHGMDVGRWLATQRRDWHLLHDGQRERLTRLGIGPAERLAVPVQKAIRRAGGGAFERGIAALAQYKAREGKITEGTPKIARRHPNTTWCMAVQHPLQACRAEPGTARAARRARAPLGHLTACCPEVLAGGPVP